MRDELRVYATAFKASLLARMEYRGDLLLSLLGGVCFQLGPLLAYGVLRAHAPRLGGWNGEEILFLFGMWALCLGLSELFFNNIWDFSDQVLDGSLDRLLVYPVRSLPFYLLCSPTIHAFANIAMGLGMLGYAGHVLDLGAAYWALLPLWTVCGVVIYTGTLVVLASSAVLMPGRGLDLLWLLAQVNWAARYPLNLYPAILRVGLLVLPPLGAYHYLPGLWLFKGGSLALGVGAPIAAALTCGLAASFCWDLALDRYESTGS